MQCYIYTLLSHRRLIIWQHARTLGQIGIDPRLNANNFRHFPFNEPAPRCESEHSGAYTVCAWFCAEFHSATPTCESDKNFISICILTHGVHARTLFPKNSKCGLRKRTDTSFMAGRFHESEITETKRTTQDTPVCVYGARPKKALATQRTIYKTPHVQCVCTHALRFGKHTIIGHSNLITRRVRRHVLVSLIVFSTCP